jgi:IclR family acetate operon transcriptional repressor
MARQDSSRTLRTTSTSLDVVQALKDLDGARVTELAETMDLSASTVHGHLSTLCEKGFVVKEGDIYNLGSEFLRLGHYVRTRKEGYVLAETYTQKLFEQTDHRSIFVAEHGGRGVFLYTASGNRPMWRHETIGSKLYLHDTAVGKAMLAEMPEWRVESILDRWGLPAETENTIIDRDQLYETLETVREREYATNFGENIDGLAAIGVVATDSAGSVIGAFSVSGPVKSFGDDDYRDELVSTLAKTVEEYELEISLS